MSNHAETIELQDPEALRREERRDFFRALTGAARMAGGAAFATAATSALAQTATPTDQDILNFALNLEYLESNYYSFAVLGEALPSSLTGGTGQPGAATGGRQVTFTDPVVARLAREITLNERTHVSFIRGQLGNAAIAQPAIDLSVSPTSAFSVAARSAGLIGPTESFDPYANENNFLLGAFLFEEVGVTAYKGAARFLTSPAVIEASAGILAVEAYHAAMLRTSLYTKGITAPTIITQVNAISDARDTLDGPADLDQGLSPTGSGATATSNLVPTDANGIVFGRTTGQVLNIAYLTRAAADRGGFFPNGANGNIRTSTAN